MTEKKWIDSINGYSYHEDDAFDVTNTTLEIIHQQIEAEEELFESCLHRITPPIKGKPTSLVLKCRGVRVRRQKDEKGIINAIWFEQRGKQISEKLKFEIEYKNDY